MSSGDENRRGALLAAARGLISEKGPRGVTPEAVAAAAGVPRTDFESEFADAEDCLLAVFDDLADDMRAETIAAYDGASTWIDGVRASLMVLLGYLDRDTGIARFLVLGSYGGEAPMRTRRCELLGDVARALDVGRPEGAEGGLEGGLGGEAVVGAVAAILHGRMLEQPVPKLVSLGPSIMSVIVLPYLGVEGARSELERLSGQH
jgi:AcrR family transcriptional regulator